jgi:16S rRNA (uracil1498-N3)-methyltransferase
MSHFYLPGNWSENRIIAPDSLRHHLRVRRVRFDQTFSVFDGFGKVALAKIHPDSTDKKCFIDLNDITTDTSRECPYDMTLIQGLAANEKMDWIIEKAVELGVKHIIPLQMERSIVRLDDKKIEKKRAHWEQIVISSCEQCDRSVLPSIAMPQTLQSFLASSNNADSIPIYLSPTADLKLISILKRSPGQGMTIMVGPEGGFSPEEDQEIAAKGYIGATIGSRILRTETAGMVAIAAAHSVWGQF